MENQPLVRKLTCVTLLNDPKDWEGGELQFIGIPGLRHGGHTFSLKQGYTVFHASFIGHRVLPVTKGVRMSLVQWFGGPPLR